MKKLYLFLILFLLLSGLSFASPELELQTGLSVPSIEPEFPPQPQTLVLPGPPAPGTQAPRGMLKYLSGVPFYSYLADRRSLPTNPQYSLTETGPSTDQITPILSISPSYNMTSDSYQDVEPSVMAYNNNGTVYKSTSYIKILSDGITPRIYYSTTPNFFTFYRGQLPMPSGYYRSADPLMSKNAFNGGVAPGRIYTSGLVYNPNGAPPNGIAVWHSDNGGVSWSQPTIVIANTSDSTSTFDKPAIDVSWHNGSDLGYVYTGYVYIYGGTNPATTYIGVNKSTDGGVTFGPVSVVYSAQHQINGVQVLVNYYTGDVYVLWNDFTANTIFMSTSQDQGSTWSAPETVASGNMGNYSAKLNGNVRAGSVPMARFNWVANKICVVWHEWKQSAPSNCNSLPAGYPGCTTDIWYTAKSSSGWQSKVKIGDSIAQDQFMPALDFDLTGNMTVTFYDRRDDTNNIKYNVYMARIDSNGNPLQANTRVSTFQSDPTKYTGYYPDFIGDYQDIWDQTISNVDNYFSAWVGIPVTSGVGDIYMSTVVP
jgi:hypothetical protein